MEISDNSMQLLRWFHFTTGNIYSNFYYKVDLLKQNNRTLETQEKKNIIDLSMCVNQNKMNFDARDKATN